MATWKTRWNPPERKEQQAYVSWMRFQYSSEIMFSVPNHLIRSPAQAMNEYSLGMLKGIPDIAVMAPRGQWHGLFVEMKRREGGVVSPHQEDVIMRLNNKGYRALVANGFDEAMQATQDYMNIPLTK